MNFTSPISTPSPSPTTDLPSPPTLSSSSSTSTITITSSPATSPPVTILGKRRRTGSDTTATSPPRKIDKGKRREQPLPIPHASSLPPASPPSPPAHVIDLTTPIRLLPSGHPIIIDDTPRRLNEVVTVPSDDEADVEVHDLTNPSRRVRLPSISSLFPPRHSYSSLASHDIPTLRRRSSPFTRPPLRSRSRIAPPSSGSVRVAPPPSGFVPPVLDYMFDSERNGHIFEADHTAGAEYPSSDENEFVGELEIASPSSPSSLPSSSSLSQDLFATTNSDSSSFGESDRSIYGGSSRSSPGAATAAAPKASVDPTVGGSGPRSTGPSVDEGANASSTTQPPLMRCSVCLDPPTDVSATACGHVFCEACIRQAVRIARRCPVCRRGLKMSQVCALELKLGGSVVD
ncbi:hypothetical protein BC937DRAFT_94670 [Endogone sp. FLAS-F59071]|nr:hypothetical protein BC937DRAFT_94670 [Endogone sp. FLAS-F59071]|eukprot:RUS13860.1 hypothetical protein BC937DRAFT_94670 [Endogone sp. FLAS-F59071]